MSTAISTRNLINSHHVGLPVVRNEFTFQENLLTLNSFWQKLGLSIGSSEQNNSVIFFLDPMHSLALLSILMRETRITLFLK